METTKLIRNRSKILSNYVNTRLKDLYKNIICIYSITSIKNFYVSGNSSIPLLLFLPFLLYATLLGYEYIIVVSVGVLLGGLSVSTNVLLFYFLAISCYLLLINLLKFLPFPYKYNLALALFLVILFLESYIMLSILV